MGASVAACAASIAACAAVFAAIANVIGDSCADTFVTMYVLESIVMISIFIKFDDFRCTLSASSY